MAWRARMVLGLVSIIIPVYNRPTMLLEAVKSVLAQRYRSIEIIIINDGSSDNTLDLANQLEQSHECIKVVSIENSGPGLAREAGRQLAKGEFIQYLDSDDLLHPDKFLKQVSALNNNPNCGVSYCIQELCDMDGTVIDPIWMRTGTFHSEMFPSMLGGRLWGTPVPLYRSSLLQKSGPWLGLRNQEDWEYDCRIASLGVNLHYCPETLVTIRRHDQDHLGNIQGHQEDKLRDKCKAYLAIYQHATVAGISPLQAESQHFNRMAFMLARQCAEKGLITQAKSLMSICKSGANNSKRKIEYQIYTTCSMILGWTNLAKLSALIDRLRP